MGALNPSSTAHPTLAPHTKNISQSTIRKKWKPLPLPSQDKIRQILLSIKTKRSGAGGNGRIPGISRGKQSRGARNGGGDGDGKAKSKNEILEEEYETVVRDVSEKLLARLPRMPFPPSSITTSADDFDLSFTLLRTSTLQAQSTSTTQSSRLLRRQIQREKTALKRDKAELKMLEEGLRGAREVRRMKERGLHPLARESHDGDEEDTMEVERLNEIVGISYPNEKSMFGSSSTIPTQATLNIGDDADPQLGTLLKQLTSHLLSMKNNTASMVPVLEAVDEANVALDKFALRTLDDGALRRVYGVVEG